MSAVARPVTALLVVIGLIVAAFAFTTSASAYPPGRSASLSASASAVTPGGSITVSGTHFKGLVTIRANGRSGPMVLGTVMANADGTFSTSITLPAGEFATGSYTVTATDAFGDVETLTVSVVAAAVAGNPSSGGSGLPNTGFAVAGIGGLGLLLLLGGGIMLLVGRRPKVAA